MKFNYLMFNNSMALVYSSGIPIVKQGAVSVGRFSLLSSSRTEIENCRSGVDVVVIKMVGLGRETYVVSFFSFISLMFSLLILSIVSIEKKNHTPFAVQFYYRFRINKWHYCFEVD